MSKTSKLLSWGWPCLFGIGLEGALPLFAQSSTVQSSKASKVENLNFEREAPASLRISKCDHGYLRGYGFRLQLGVHHCNQNLLLSRGYPAHYSDCRWVRKNGEFYQAWDSNSGKVSATSTAFVRGSYPWMDRLNYVLLSQIEIGNTHQYAENRSFHDRIKNSYLLILPVHWRYFFRGSGHFGFGAHGVVAAAPDLKFRPEGVRAPQAQLKMKERWLHQVGLHAETSFLNFYRSTVWIRMPLVQGSTAEQQNEVVQCAFQSPISWSIKFNASACCLNSFLTSSKFKTFTAFLNGFLEFKGWLCSQRLEFQSKDDEIKSRGKDFGCAKGVKIHLPWAFDLDLGWDSSLEKAKMHDNQASILEKFFKKLIFGKLSLSLTFNYRQDMELKEQLNLTAQRQMVLKTKLASRCNLVEDLSPHLLFGIQEEFCGNQEESVTSPHPESSTGVDNNCFENPEFAEVSNNLTAVKSEINKIDNALKGVNPFWFFAYEHKKQLTQRLCETKKSLAMRQNEDVSETNEAKAFREESEALLQNFEAQLNRLLQEKRIAPGNESDEDKNIREASLKMLEEAEKLLSAVEKNESETFNALFKLLGSDETLKAWSDGIFCQAHFKQFQDLKAIIQENEGKTASEEAIRALKPCLEKTLNGFEKLLKKLQTVALEPNLQVEDWEDLRELCVISSNDVEAFEKERSKLQFNQNEGIDQIIECLKGYLHLAKLNASYPFYNVYENAKVAVNRNAYLQSLENKKRELNTAIEKLEQNPEFLNSKAKSPGKFEKDMKVLSLEIKHLKKSYPLIEGQLLNFPVEGCIKAYIYDSQSFEESFEESFEMQI